MQSCCRLPHGSSCLSDAAHVQTLSRCVSWQSVGLSKRNNTLSQELSISCLPQITVDGDTSTNDAVLGLASGAAGGTTIKHANSEEAQQLEAAVTALLQVGHSCPTD